MKRLIKFLKLTGRNCGWFFVILFAMLNQSFFVQANQIDIGIFETVSFPKKNEVRIRPDFNISSIQTITGILYTIRWDDPAITITTQNIFPFFVSPQGSPVLYNGYYYQVFTAVPSLAIAMNANQEYIISTFTYTNGNCAKFQLITDEWTQTHNGNFYIELVGNDVTGIIYNGNVVLGSAGGNISGNDTVYLGNTTGPMVLSGYNGSILIWQRKVNEGSWNNITGTTGMSTYSETPPLMADYYYRVSVQKSNCPAVYSDIFHLVVVVEIEFILKVFLEGAYQNPGMTTSLNDESLIPLSQPYFLSPWNYEGSESVVTIPPNVVDWILLDIRESEGDAFTATSETSIFRRAAFLMSNGSIKDIDGLLNPTAVLSYHDNLYIVIIHRNHLSVISAVPPPIIGEICTFDFTSGENQVLGGILGHKQIYPGIWGLIAGDANSDGNIDSADKQIYWELDSGIQGYNSSDFSLDAQTNNQDKNDSWIFNQGFSSQVPE
jgi:hypothetical protein